MIRYYFTLALIALVLTGCQKPTMPAKESALNDRQVIALNGKIALTVEHPDIVHYFQSSFLCDDSNRMNHQDFCGDVSTLIERIYFETVMISPNQKVIGFAIGSSELEPDTAVGIYQMESEQSPLTFLTPYYLGNQFIGFSPSGTYFAYQADCFEGYCGLYVRQSDTLATRDTINSAEYADERTKKVVFSRWISDTEIEYWLGEQLNTFDFSER
ncbi:hypothetical protein IPJ72_07415 [Candidatus Peregrinibacteria bacterium]|nr:MAG: hypothetical protein IPJ72_07415 [Candidatus Peregrinibacteria bacterium]